MSIIYLFTVRKQTKQTQCSPITHYYISHFTQTSFKKHPHQPAASDSSITMATTTMYYHIMITVPIHAANMNNSLATEAN